MPTMRKGERNERADQAGAGSQEPRRRASWERAFEVFTAGMGRWWRKDHSILKSPQVDVVLEKHAGGRWYERGEDGSECEWGPRSRLGAPARILLAWQIDGDWKYDPDFLTEVEVRFVEEEARRTRVELEHRLLERYGEKAETVRAMLNSAEGWSGGLRLLPSLFANFLRKALSQLVAPSLPLANLEIIKKDAAGGGRGVFLNSPQSPSSLSGPTRL